MTLVLPGVGSVQVPQAQARLRFTISRNMSYAINAIVRRVPIKSQIGLFNRTKFEDVARVRNIEPNWKDGDYVPADDPVRHEWVEFRTGRYSSPYRFGSETVEQANNVGWDIIADAAAISARREMLKMSFQVEKAMLDTGVPNSTLAEAGAGSWVGSTVANGYIQKTLNYIVDKIRAQTFGLIGDASIGLALGYKAARAMIQSPEVKEYFYHYERAYDLFRRGEVAEAFSMGDFTPFGVSQIVPFINEFRVTTKRNETTATRRPFEDYDASTYWNPVVGFVTTRTGNSPAVSRDRSNGNANVPVNEPAMDSVWALMKEEMGVDARFDAFHRRVEGNVVNNYKIQLNDTSTLHVVKNVLNES